MRELSRVLVTGGAGFLGLALCERLLAEGVDVVCVDDLSTSAPGAATLLPITVSGAGSQTRSLCFVDDTVSYPDGLARTVAWFRAHLTGLPPHVFPEGYPNRKESACASSVSTPSSTTPRPPW